MILEFVCMRDQPIDVRRILQAVGPLGTAQRVKSAARARGWSKWAPLVPAEPFSASCDLAIDTLRAAGHEFGDYLEFGVSRGTSMACMYHALSSAGLTEVRLVGFDSFQGLPPEAAAEGWVPGAFASTIRATRHYLTQEGVDLGQVNLVKGWFRETLTGETAARLDLVKASLIMVDCDIYTASKEALWFCEPLIRDRAVIFFDDWGSAVEMGEKGEREAYAEFLDTFSDFSSESLPAYVRNARAFLVTRASQPPAS